MPPGSRWRVEPATRRAARWVAAALIASAFIGAMSACAGNPAHLQIAQQTSAPPGGAVSIGVVDRGRHTDIAIPADALRGRAAKLRHDFPGARTVVFGFGDEGYLMSRQVTLGTTLTALFPGHGVILATGLSTSAAKAFGADRVATLRVTCAQLDAISRFIEQSLTRSAEDGSADRLANGPYPGSAFYATDDTYDLLHNCNRWTADALVAGGLPVDPRGVILADELMAQVRVISREQQRSESAAASPSSCPSLQL